MKISTTISLVSLLVLTVTVGVLSSFEEVNKNWFILILGLSCVKFLIVAFQFMDVKNAHVAWKIMLITYLLIFFSAISILLL